MDRRPFAVAALLLLLGPLLGGCGTSSFGLGINQLPPTITSQPQSQIVNLGQSATFSVTATGSAPLTYQWQENGMNIPGATAASYTTPSTTMMDNGAVFRVTVSNSLGSQTSNPAALSFNSVNESGTDVSTYKNDLARTGQNLTETALTLENVNSTIFGLLRNLAVTGKVDAQPLYLSQFNINGTPHNVVYVATEHDLVYAFDSDNAAMLWMAPVLEAGETPSDNRGCNQVSPEIGVTATPVIDRNAGPHGAIFVVAMSKDGSGNYHQRLHALDLTSGAELFGGPKEVQATYPGQAGQTTFEPAQYKERPGLLLLNGQIYTSWSSHCDNQPYTGWIISYNETSLAQTTIFNIAPNSNGGGPSIWMSGGAPAVDSAGNIYLLAANGVFETTLANGFPSGGDYGNAFVKISTTNNALAVADYFEMDHEVSENGSDADLGSGAAMLLPDFTDSGGTVRHLAVGAGKDSNLYVVNRDNMGKFSATSNNIWQELDGALPGGIWSTPAYFNHVVYYGDVGGTLKAFTITNAKLSTSPAFETTTSFGYPGTAPAVSANGSSNGIVWAAENSSPAILHAYNALNLAELYNSGQAGARDHCGDGNKFITPTIADGKVLLGTQTSVCVFGLLPQ
ncbi:MAG TPA: immunoglobulin domain-containing protein [Candidatus Acidoferrales bacterium]|nr:immunoglobulin domain-containing protein [Candidatus Acidoferrales bacterium]